MYCIGSFFVPGPDYVGRWKPKQERWVDMYASLSNSPGHTLEAWNSMSIYDMIFTQPVYYAFKNPKMPTLLLIVTPDNTAIGKGVAPAGVKAKLGVAGFERPLIQPISEVRVNVVTDCSHR